MKTRTKQLAFFTAKKVTGAEMLYRASENEFLVSKWHEKCDHIPHTLTIIETEFGKVIGGYTSFNWYKDTTGHSVSSRKDSNGHFIFSLTNNDRFTITQNEANCIYIYDNDTYGPIFGGPSWDLYIYDKANQNNSSGVQIGHAYTNPNYKNADNASYVKFAGARNFKIN